MKLKFASLLAFATIFAAICTLSFFEFRNDDEFSNFFIEYDKNKDGKLDISEFIEQPVPGNLAGIVNKGELSNQFHILDLNCDGYIKEGEMRQVADKIKSDQTFNNRRGCSD